MFQLMGHGSSVDTLDYFYDFRGSNICQFCKVVHKTFPDLTLFYSAVLLFISL